MSEDAPVTNEKATPVSADDASAPPAETAPAEGVTKPEEVAKTVEEENRPVPPAGPFSWL